MKKHSKPSRTITTTQAANLAPDLWDTVLEPYASDPDNAFIVAQIFSLLKETLHRGPHGLASVSRALDAGIDQLFPFSDIYAASLQLYHLAVAGNLRPEFEPSAFVALAAEAMETQGGKSQ